MNRHAYLAERDIEITEGHRGFGGPVVPAGWRASRQTKTLWWTFITETGQRLAAYKINEVGERGLFEIYGDQDRLEAIAANNDEVMPALEALRRGYDHGGGPIDAGTALGGAQETTARRMLRALRWWRCDVIEDDGGGPVAKLNVVRELSAFGVVLPNLNSSPLNWDLDATGAEVSAGSAVRRVTRLVHPAGAHTFSGHQYDRVFEAEPDRG